MNESLRVDAIGLARHAGAVLMDFYGREFAVGSKSNSIDLVTDADRAAEEALLEVLARRFPGDQVLGEEGGDSGPAGASRRWVLDPLDGTVNFAHRIPHFAVLVAAQTRVGEGWETEVACTFDPIRDEAFSTQRGVGAYLGEQRLAVSTTQTLANSSVATGFPYDRLGNPKDNHREFCRLNFITRGARRLGSAGLDLAYVAAGRFDAFWERGLQPWDMAGGVLMVTEAGGITQDFAGRPPTLAGGEVVATNSAVATEMMRALESALEHPINSRDGLEEFLPAARLAELAD